MGTGLGATLRCGFRIDDRQRRGNGARVQSGRAKKWVFRALAVGCSLLLVALVLEVGLRVMYARDQARGGDLQKRLERSRHTALGSTSGSFNMAGLVQPSPFPDVVYMLKPGLRGDFRGRQVAINEAGLRGPEVTPAKPAGVFRIAGLGDSVMFGWGVGQGEEYLRVLEQRLNARGGPTHFECLNFAVPGYNSYMEAAVLDLQGLAYDPDLVIVHFINNDLGLPLFMENPPDPVSLRGSRLLELIRKRRAWARGDVAEYLEVRKTGQMTPEEMHRVSGPYQHMTGGAGFEFAMARLARATGHAPPRPGEPARRRIPVILMRGTFTPGQGALLDAAIQQYGFIPLDIGPVTQRRMRELGIPDDPAAQAQAIRIGPGDSHPNALGHTIYADGLQELLEAEGLLPAKLETGNSKREIGIPASESRTSPRIPSG